jgi:murein DD-endopeptidase MepM/ murein hydrolase activator NlpD
MIKLLTISLVLLLYITACANTNERKLKRLRLFTTTMTFIEGPMIISLGGKYRQWGAVGFGLGIQIGGATGTPVIDKRLRSINKP